MNAQSIFERAAARAGQQGLAYAGAVTCEEAHALQEAGQATILDVRTRSEFEQVGHVKGTQLIEWRRDGEHQPDPRFIERLSSRISGDMLLSRLAICDAWRCMCSISSSVLLMPGGKY